MATSFWRGLWRLADPKISLASISSMFLGSAIAGADGPLHWGWLAVTVAGILAIEVAKNAAGEIVDYDSGTDLKVAPGDRSPFSGGKRVMVEGLLTRQQMLATSAVSYLVGIGLGLWITLSREPAVLWLGLLGVAGAFFYHAPPLRLSYRGLGELAVALCYGPIICAGTYLVQRGTVAAPPLLLSIPLGLLVAAFLWVNEFPDYPSDKSVGRRNLVVLLGRPAASRWFAAINGVAFILLLLLPAAGAPPSVYLAGVSALPVAFAVRRLWTEPENTQRLIAAQIASLATFVLYALSAGVGYALG